MIKIAITDNEPIICDGMESLLNSHGGFEVICKAYSGVELLYILNSLKTSNNLPDIVLLDIEMEELDGIKVLKKISALYPEIKPVIISYHYSPLMIHQAISKGARGYIHKNWHTERVIRNILNVASNKHFYEDEVTDIFINQQLNFSTAKNKSEVIGSKLTDRENEILQLICYGKTTKEISAMLRVTPKTVESHRYSLYRKANVTNSAGLVSYAITNGLFIPGKGDF